MTSLSFIAVAAHSAQHFALSATQFDGDDPFSAILIYRAWLSQPWDRIDISRTIVDLVFSPSETSADLVALSDEGDIYLVQATIKRAKILGAGVSSEDADGRGRTTLLCASGEKLWIAGDNGQLYSGGFSNGWEQITLQPQFQPAAMIPDNSGGVLLAGDMEIAQQLEQIDTSDPQAILSALRAGRADRAAAPASARLYHVLASGRVREIALPAVSHIRGMATLGGQEFCIFGVNGLFMSGDLDRGLVREDIGLSGQTILTAAAAPVGVILGTDRHWEVYDGAKTTPFSLGLINEEIMHPLRAIAADEGTLLVDYLAAPLWRDGAVWKVINLPQALQKRHFDADAFLKQR
ncbi:hypothetical protein C8J27_1187 [Rhodobacter aestuarii]|uniref:Uncharacterized protein n=1 Tax=Rhodobacter aestuarii TaxID=453582 RepID=A0A1N7QHF6_9RHOB|nr:hypothetical protein [Rhodobacter aestuarii]PTV93350.1 hypothetical protein C8J27_1187 [Rhodobacter aestuarii]SIT22312.1 hypothetical protein SAMN05421580_12013 [Rhodobacter aestuarii]